MPYETVRDILERVRRFHRRLSCYYEESTEVSRNEKTRLLLDYMGRHERNINRCLAKYKKEAADAVLDTWMQYIPDSQLREAFQEAKIEPEMSPEEVFAHAMRIDGALVAFYEQLTSYSAAPTLQELFENLLELEKTKDAEYARSLLDAQ